MKSHLTTIVGKVRQNRYGILLLLMVLLLMFISVTVGTTMKSDPVVPTSKGVIAPAYVIYKRGSTIYAHNGQKGVNYYSGTDASTVIQKAIDALGTGGGKIFIKPGNYTITRPIRAKHSGLELCGVYDATILTSAGINGPHGLIETGTEVTGLKIHDLKLVGRYWDTFNPAINPAIHRPQDSFDGFGILITGGLAKEIHIYNMRISNFSAGVYASGGGVPGTSRDWNIHHITHDQANAGAVLIRSQCTLLTNVIISDIHCDKWNDGLIEVAADNAGNRTLAGELTNVTISNVQGTNGAYGGIGLVAVSPTEPGCKLHSVTVRGRLENSLSPTRSQCYLLGHEYHCTEAIP